MAAQWNLADSDDEFRDDEEKGFSGKTVLLVMVDSSPEMFEQWGENDDVPFKAAMKCCHAMWRSKVVSNSKDLVGLLLVGTEQNKSSSDTDFENLYVYQDLSPVKVSMIEQLNELASSEDFEQFKESIGSSNQYNLKDVFWLAKIIFDEGRANTYQKKILYFTRNDNPHGGKSNMQTEAIKKFKDVGKVNFEIVSFCDEFNFNAFYSQILEDESAITKAENVKTLMKVVRVKQRLRRPVVRSTLEVAPGMKIGVGFYSFVRPAQQPKSVNINKRNNEIIQKNVNEFRSDSGMSVLKSEERKVVKVQNEEAVFTKGEIKQVQSFHQSGVVLLGFLDADTFNHFTWYRSPGYFIYPDEDQISGSKDLFVALLKRCHTLKKIALVKMVLSRGRTPKIACLLPSVEDRVFPQGFHVFPIPFSDEIREDMELKMTSNPTEELVSLMEKVIKKITNKTFDVSDVYNPALQHRWRELECIALNIPPADQDEFIDLSEPNEHLMMERLGNLPNEIEKEVGKMTAQFDKTRSTASVLFSTPKLAMDAKHGRLEKLTIPILKGFLDSKNIDTNRMKKADLVQAVYQYFEANGYN